MIGFTTYYIGDTGLWCSLYVALAWSVSQTMCWPMKLFLLCSDAFSFQSFCLDPNSDGTSVIAAFLATMTGIHLPVGVLIIFCNLLFCSGSIAGINKYIPGVYTQSTTTISDCFVQQINNVTHIRCAVLAERANAFAFAYDEHTSDCLVCLPPYTAGPMPRSSLPVGLPVWLRGKIR